MEKVHPKAQKVQVISVVKDRVVQHCSATGREPEGRLSHGHVHSALPSSSLGCCLAFILPHLWYLENNMTSAWRRAVALPKY